MSGTKAEIARLKQMGIKTKEEHTKEDGLTAEEKRAKELGVNISTKTYGVDENGRTITGFFTDEEGVVHPITSGSGSKGGVKKGKTEKKDEQKENDLTEKKENDKIKEEKQKEFVAAKSIEAAENYARDSLGIVANYKGIDVEVANEMNAAFKRGIDICPAIKDKLKMVGNAQKANRALKQELTQYFENMYRRMYPNSTADWFTKMAKKSARLPSVREHELAYAKEFSSPDSGANAILDRYNGIFINERQGKDRKNLINSLKRDEQNKWHPVGCDTAAYLFDHEVAHVMDNVLGLKSNAEMRALFNSYSREEIGQGLSRYAIDKHKIEEFIAEGWAEYCNNPKPRKIATEIAKIIEKEIKKK